MPDAEETEVITTDSPKGAADKPSPASSQRTMVIALAVAVLAVLVAGGWFLYSRHSGYSDDQVNEAKARVCTQTELVARGVRINTHLESNDDIGAWAVRANARLALASGGAYLHDLLRENPAAPSDLTDAVDDVADTISELAVNYMAQQPDDAQIPLRKSLEDQLKRVDDLCKQQ